MKQKIEKMTAYFDAAIAGCAEREKALLADERKDEAVFEKIRANVYNIFRTILGAAGQNCGGESEKARGFFMKQIEHIPASWQTTLDAAVQHHDAAKAHIEEVKLAVVQEIRAEFEKIWEENL